MYKYQQCPHTYLTPEKGATLLRMTNFTNTPKAPLLGTNRGILDQFLCYGKPIQETNDR